MGTIRNMGSAFNAGMNIGAGAIGKVAHSGFRPLGGMAATGIYGAMAGAGLSGLSGGQVDPATGAMVGAAVGAAALPVAGTAVGAIGSAGVAAAKAAPGIAMGIGKGALAASPVVAGAAALGAASVGEKAWSIGSRMINWDEAADAMHKVKFTTPISGIAAGWKSGGTFSKGFQTASGFKGKTSAFFKDAGQNIKAGIGKTGKAIEGSIINGTTLIAGAMALEGITNAWNTLETAKMGQMTGVQTMTPRLPSYANNAGATGDLVFALNKNRRG